MSFREKSAWIMLIMIVLMTSLWTAHMPWWRPFTLAPDPNPIVFHALILATVGFVVIVVVAHIVIAVLAPRDANARADERERLIGLKATAVAFHVASAGAITAAGAVAVGLPSSYVVNGLLAIVVLAEIVRQAIIVTRYRLGIG